MKKIHIGIILPIVMFMLALLFSVHVFGATLRTDTNPPATTKVGTPVDSIAACPIPGGKVTCGSQAVPSANGCGHCDPAYIGNDSDIQKMCSDPSYPGIHYAMDVGSNYLDPVYMPSVNGASIKWVFGYQAVDKDGITAIQYYGGTNEATGEQFWIQFHHTKPGSGAGTLYPGDQGAQICQSGCKIGSGPHVHIEFAKVDSSGAKIWQDAPNYFCKSN